MIELSGLGLAVTTVVTIAEILKSHNLVSIKRKYTAPLLPSLQHCYFNKKPTSRANTHTYETLPLFLTDIKTSLVDPHPDGHTMAPKAKIQVWIEKTDQFDQLVSSFGYQMRPNHSASGVSVNANYSGSLTGSPNINASPNSNASASAVSTASPVAESQSQGGDKDLSGNKGPSLYHHHHQREQEANQCESNEGSTTVGSTAVGAESSVEADKSQSGDGGGSMGQNGHEGGQACSSSGTSTGSKV